MKIAFPHERYEQIERRAIEIFKAKSLLWMTYGGRAGPSRHLLVSPRKKNAKLALSKVSRKKLGSRGLAYEKSTKEEKNWVSCSRGLA